MRRTLLAVSFLPLPFLAVCADEGTTNGDDPEANLPGDIDNSTDSLGGKADAWDYTNDPARLARNLNYKLADLPRNGKLDKPVWRDRYPKAVGKAPVAWSDTYWPSYIGSTNARWQGSDEKSPLEKYDQAFNGAAGCAEMPDQLCGAEAKKQWGDYLACAGPAAKWSLQHFQNIFEQVDGIDNDTDGQTDECDDSDDEGTQGWWGLCHAWTPAALLEPEPQKAVTYNGVTFTVGDIKALIATVYDANEAMMLGGRCNEKEIKPENTASANLPCEDTNPGSLHVIVTNFIGINDSALAMDRTRNYEVWNQPIVSYDITQQDEVTSKRAQECVGGTGDKYSYNKNAKKLFEVRMGLDFLVEGDASANPLGMDGYVYTDTYHYILEVGTYGKVIGGRFCTDNTRRPDFLWAPLRVSASAGRRNPNVAYDKIQTLLNLAFADEVAPSTGSEKVFENKTATAIPDNNAGGVGLDITVAETIAFASLSVSVDIQHTYRGDLVVQLLRDGTLVQTLQNHSGGSAANLVQTWTFPAAQVGGNAAKAKWTLKVIDDAAADTGTVKLFKLAFAQ